jgi:SAM-dependent methyltransferase
MDPLKTNDLTLKDRLARRDLRVHSKGPIAYTISSALHYGLRAVLGRRVRRDQSHIQAEYHDANRDEYWRETFSIDDLIFGDDRTSKWILNQGRLEVGTDRTSRRYLLDRLVTRLRELLPAEGGSVIEFGAGSGRNLLHVAREMPGTLCRGLELTPSTVHHANEIAQGAGLDVQLSVGDMLQRSIPQRSYDVAFSVHALEQLPRDYAAAIENMMSVARRAVVLFEPVYELFPHSLRGFAARARIYNADHLDGLLHYLRKRSETRIEYAKAMPTVGNPLNQTAEIVVIPTVRKD